MTGSNLPTKVHQKRRYSIVVAFAVIGILFVVYILPLYFNRSSNEPGTATESPSVQSDSLYARELPVRLEIPSINIDTTFVEPLGLNVDQTVSVPDSYEKVGWYKNGASPGEVGPAVILGHVDSRTGPAVFYSLGQVKVGDEVRITRADGSVAVFEIKKLARYSQDEFPTLDVYGPTSGATLRLVTCSGTYDRGQERYSHNLVLYGELKNTN